MPDAQEFAPKLICNDGGDLYSRSRVRVALKPSVALVCLLNLFSMN